MLQPLVQSSNADLNMFHSREQYLDPRHNKLTQIAVSSGILRAPKWSRRKSSTEQLNSGLLGSHELKLTLASLLLVVSLAFQISLALLSNTSAAVVANADVMLPKLETENAVDVIVSSIVYSFILCWKQTFSDLINLVSWMPSSLHSTMYTRLGIILSFWWIFITRIVCLKKPVMIKLFFFLIALSDYRSYFFDAIYRFYFSICLCFLSWSWLHIVKIKCFSGTNVEEDKCISIKCILSFIHI